MKKFVRWFKAALAIIDAIGQARKELACLDTARSWTVHMAIDDAVRAVECAAGVELPDDLIGRIVEADLRIAREYYAERS